MIEPVVIAAEKVGGVAKLARALGVRHQTFYSWRRIPAERVLDIERASGVPRHQLRPDLYPVPADVPRPIPHPAEETAA